MATERYVVLGLATARSRWFTELARWATMGSIPVEFVKCISADELRARLESGRRFSALLVDAATGALDRDLADLAGRHGVTLVVVDGTEATPARWSELGVDSVLAPEFTREALLGVLDTHSRMIGAGTALPTDVGADGDHPPSGPVATPLVAITGAGGAGASTVAVATAQALAAREELAGRVVLADLCLDAEQAMLHDARDVVPGVQELAEAHRTGRPGPEQIRSLTFDVVTRRYRLLLGLRRHRDWTVLRPRTFEASLSGLSDTFSAVVADVDPDLEGDEDTGVVEVEERNLMARSVMGRADVVIVVGAPGMKGLHAMIRVVTHLSDHAVPPERILAVINRGPRSPRARAELTGVLAELTSTPGGESAVVGPVFLGDRRGVDELHRDGAAFPSALTQPLDGAVAALIDRLGHRGAEAPPVPEPITPGSLGMVGANSGAGA